MVWVVDKDLIGLITMGFSETKAKLVWDEPAEITRDSLGLQWSGIVLRAVLIMVAGSALLYTASWLVAVADSVPKEECRVAALWSLAGGVVFSVCYLLAKTTGRTFYLRQNDICCTLGTRTVFREKYSTVKTCIVYAPDGNAKGPIRANLILREQPSRSLLIGFDSIQTAREAVDELARRGVIISWKEGKTSCEHLGQSSNKQ